MNFIKEQDLENLSEEDIKLLFTYFEEKEKLYKEVESLEIHELKNKDYKEKLARYINFDLIQLYDSRRNGLNILNEIFNSLSLFEYCSRIWEDYFKILAEQKSNRFNFFENQYQLLRKSGRDHYTSINQIIIEEEKEYQTNNLHSAFEIGSMSFHEVSKNIEKYDILLNNAELKLSLEKPKLEMDYESITLKYSNDIENHVKLMESGIIDDHEQLFRSFLEQNAFKIMKAKLWKELINDIKNYEESISYLRADDITLNRQVLAILSLLKEIGVSQIDTTRIAEFIQFITKRDLNYSKIKNTEIYKKLQKQNISTKDEEILNQQFAKIGMIFKI